MSILARRMHMTEGKGPIVLAPTTIARAQDDPLRIPDEYVISQTKPVPTDLEPRGQAEAEKNTEAVFPVSPSRAKVLRIPRIAPALQRTTLLQQWEGTVADISERDFVAVIRDLTNPSNPEEQAVFAIEDAADPDRSLILRGAIFYWSIGYEETPAKTRKTFSIIRFRRLPAWTRSEIHAMQKEAVRLRRLLESGS